MKKTITAIAVATMSILSGCAGSKAGVPPVGVPDWYVNQPSGGGIYGTGEQQSNSLQLAKEQADFAGCKEIAQTLGQKVEGLTKQYLGQEGAVKSSEAKEALANAARSIVNINLTGCVNKKREVRELPDGSYRVFSLEFLDPAGAVAAAKGARDAQQALAQSKQTFDELDQLLSRDVQGPKAP